ncbi:hypothetical protein GCM10023091_14230 [Ravibacter arvi]|uniref:DUF4221 domain-containing protein n=1 Tax=Ravibacter arvi TaxID=2051041 RepID=A0ABP8LUQ2_9BACT
MKKIQLLGLLTLAGIGVVAALTLNSKFRIYSGKGFTRIFLPHAVSAYSFFDLPQAKSYISGVDSTSVYISSISDPFSVLSITSKDHSLKKNTIQLSEKQRSDVKNLDRARVAVFPPYFYVFNGTAPYIFEGEVSTWKAIRLPAPPYYSEIIPFSPSTFVFRGVQKKDRHSVLGKWQSGMGEPVLAPTLLEAQVDGIFCVDGKLIFNKSSNTLVYLYHHRNQYFLIDTTLRLLKRFHTIDTTSIAQIRVTKGEAGNTRYLSSPPAPVNQLGKVWQNFLLVNSAVIAENENRNQFKHAAVIDVYDLTEGNYLFSFYLKGPTESKMTDFAITDSGHLAGLFGQRLTFFSLGSVWQK